MIIMIIVRKKFDNKKFGGFLMLGRNYLSLYDPFREMDNFMGSFWNTPFYSGGQNDISGFGTDITDEGNAYKLTADLPGFSKDDIKIDIDDKSITLSAERHSEHEEEDKKGKYIRCERSYGSYSRSFSLRGIDADSITAKYDNGVLTVNLPKKEPEAPKNRRLEIE